MNKKLTALEAFDDIKNTYILASRGNGDFLPEWLREELLAPIEAVLKNEDEEKFKLIQQVRELKDDVASLESCNSKLWIEKDENEKKLKVLEIITSKLGTAQIKDKYIMFFGEDEEPLTKEEYDLIQEILL